VVVPNINKKVVFANNITFSRDIKFGSAQILVNQSYNSFAALKKLKSTNIINILSYTSTVLDYEHKPNAVWCSSNFASFKHVPEVD